ncbi:MAG: hypothetical protein HPY82_06975 [Gammaproteobacteria bacterium]|nr:hypothetical protein [Gammaproteobacteria bacterium]
MTIASEWPLPGLLPAADTRQIDIHIRRGSVADFQPAVCFQASPQQVLVWLPDIARIRVCGGNDILVEPLHPDKHDAIALFLLNHALAIVMLQRGLLVLHAGAVLAGDQCVALAGPSGAGKSTLLAALHGQGYTVAGDELCVLRVDADGAMVLPGPRVMQVWAAALPSLADCAWVPVRAGLPKYFVPLSGDIACMPLRELCVLRWGDDGSPRRVRLTGTARLEALLHQVYQPRYVDGMQLWPQVGAQCLRLARQISVTTLTRRRDLATLPASLSCLFPAAITANSPETESCRSPAICTTPSA